MTRRASAILIVVVLAGLAPASAIIGYCARMPCCHHAQQPLKVSADAGDCCTTVACYDTPSVKLTGNAVFAKCNVAQTLLSAPPVHRQECLWHTTNSPPPTTQQRLAILSTLLI